MLTFRPRLLECLQGYTRQRFRPDILAGLTVGVVALPLAIGLGNAKAVRAVGLANGRNPISIIIPCHRVIGADGSLTGYGGGLPRKQWLLAHEKGRGGGPW